MATNNALNEEKIKELLDKLGSFYTKDMITWLASLFDPYIGGFYYSNSARDNLGFLPDIESTNQALAILERTGAIASYDAMPGWIKRKIAFFVCQREDSETGFFFHPQWKYEVNMSHMPRLSRDLNSAKCLASGLSFGLSDKNSKASNELKKVKQTEIAEYLSSEESLLSFLDKMPMNHETASFITSQSDLLKLSGLDGTVCDWFISKQNPKTGLFEDTDLRTSISTFSAASSFFMNNKRILPNSVQAVPHILEHLSGDEIGNVCYASACWRSLADIYDMNRHNKAVREKLVNDIYFKAEKPLSNTIDILSISKREDGSFSYNPNESNKTSQGMPTAVPHTCEGDVNATLLAVGIIISAYRALGLDSIRKPIFNSDDFAHFLEKAKLFDS